MTSGSNNIVNLRQARKRKARADKDARAEENRIRFGRRKAERDEQRHEADRETRRHDGHRIERTTDRDD